MKEYDYYHNLGGEIHSNFSLPKLLFTHEYYRHLSTDSKVLYAMFLEKMKDCKQNGWQDSKNRAYILYPLKEMGLFLNVSTFRLFHILGELEVRGLMEQQEVEGEVRIYVKNFATIKLDTSLKPSQKRKIKDNVTLISEFGGYLYD